MFVPPEDVPVARLLKNAEAMVEKAPNAAEARYTVARIHYLAFSRGSRTVPAYLPSDRRSQLRIPSEYLTGQWVETERWRKADERARVEIGETGVMISPEKHKALQDVTRRIHQELTDQGWSPPPEIDAAARGKHAAAAMAAFREAIRLAPQNGLYVLGLASLTEEITRWKTSVPRASVPSELATVDFAQAKAAYLRAFDLGYEKESQFKSLGLEGRVGLVSHEAGVGYLRLGDRDRAAGQGGNDAERAKIEAAVEKLRKLPRGIVTPIIFSCSAGACVDTLLLKETYVNFDLRGHGSREQWPWVGPDTGLLVWDPRRTGRITSAIQLFGGYTFQIFRANGYDALAALDDDGDGFLRGTELDGIRVWFDRNSDGISTPEEVVDLAECGIVGLAVKADGMAGIHPTNSRGLEMADGRTLPTWDWMAEPITK